MAEKTYIITESWVRRVEAAMAKLERITGSGVSNTPYGVSIAPSTQRPSLPQRIPTPLMAQISSNATAGGMYNARLYTWNGLAFDPTGSSGPFSAYDAPTGSDDALVGNLFEAEHMQKHMIDAGDVVVGWARGITTDGKVYMETWHVPSPAMFCRLTQGGGGSDGSSSTYASWQYDIYSADGANLQGSAATAKFQRLVHGSTGSGGKAGYGLANDGKGWGTSSGGGPILLYPAEQINNNWP